LPRLFAFAALELLVVKAAATSRLPSELGVTRITKPPHSILGGGLGRVGFGVEWSELEADYPLGRDGVAVDLGGGKVPTMRGLQRLVGEISARAGGEEFGGGDVAGGVDMELDGNVNGAADGGARFR